MMNPFAIAPHPAAAIPGFDMGKPLEEHLAKPARIGIKGPWTLNPGNPMFPNHRPYLTNVHAPNMMAPPPPQTLKTT